MEAQQQLETNLFLDRMREVRMVRENHADDWQHQAGRYEITSVFEEKLKKLVPGLRFVSRSLSERTSELVGLGSKLTPTRAVMWDHRDPKTGASVSEYVGGYLYPLAQEYDVLVMKPKVVLRVDEKTGFLDRKVEGPAPDPTKYDLSKPVYEGSDLHLASNEEYSFEPSRIIPGWRGVLARLVTMGIATPTQVESFFSVGERLSWAVKMGRRDERLPF